MSLVTFGSPNGWNKSLVPSEVGHNVTWNMMWSIFPAQAIDSIHQVGLYCLALVPANTLPKTPLGGIHICETKQNFLEGNLHPCNILMCPHTCVTNLPKPRQKQPGRPPQTIPNSAHYRNATRREYQIFSRCLTCCLIESIHHFES